jgi:hypothetical protein
VPQYYGSQVKENDIVGTGSMHVRKEDVRNTFEANMKKVDNSVIVGLSKEII